MVAFLGGAIGPAELLVVLIAVLFLFGPKRLPEMARTLGDTMTKLRRASDDMRDQIMHADRTEEPPPAVTPPPAIGVESATPATDKSVSAFEEEKKG